MADPLKPIVRSSTDIAQKYAAGGNFGLGAAKAGKPSLASTDFMDAAHQYQTEFTPFETSTTFTPSALNYATTKYGINTKKYGDGPFPTS